MLHENLKNLRKAKGLSQEELAEKVHVVRQTVSKWEQGLSVPDAELLIRLADALETSVGTLLGETEEPEPPSALQEIAAKLELLNEQFARQQERKRKGWRCVFVLLGLFTLCSIVIEVILLFSRAVEVHSVQQSLGIIGGADGPTAIFVTRSPLGIGPLILLMILLVISVIGILRTRRH